MDAFFEELRLYKVVPNYIEALRDENNGGDLSVYKVDGNKGNRPFVGIITICNELNYFIPLTSYKDRFKYLTSKELDFTPIYRKGKLVAGVEFNKMIPVPLNQIRPLDMNLRRHDNAKVKESKLLRRYEYEWCNSHRNEIVKKAQELYTMYVEDDVRYKNKKYCLNFPELDKIFNKYELDHPAQY